MSKNVILVTLAGMLWAGSGSALAQANNVSRGPVAGTGLSTVNGMFIALPTVSALSLPTTVAVAHTPGNLSTSPSLGVAASKFTAGTPTHGSKSLHLADAAPGLESTTPGTEKSSKVSGSLRKTQEDSRSVERHAKRPHQIPICE